MEKSQQQHLTTHDSSVDGAGLLRALRAGMGWLERNAASINALNVFPVPDGDTGTNMFLTMKADGPKFNATQIFSSYSCNKGRRNWPCSL